jgi:hypothetical protein
MRKTILLVASLFVPALLMPVCHSAFITIPWYLMPAGDAASTQLRFAEVTADVELALGDLDGLDALEAGSLASLPDDATSVASLDALAPEDRAAMVAFAEWGRRGGEIPSPGCLPHPVHAVRVERLRAVASAALQLVTGPDDPLLVAIVRVASQLAARGDVIQTRAGLELAAGIGRTMTARGWSLPTELSAMVPRREDVRRAWARTAWCLAQSLDQGRRRWMSVPQPEGVEDDVGWPVFGLVLCKRELLLVQQFYADALQPDSWHNPELTMPHCAYATRRLEAPSAFVVGDRVCREIAEDVALVDEVAASLAWEPVAHASPDAR